MQKFIHRNRKGFSLIELIVVMAVMAILVLLAAPRFLGYTKDAAVSAMQADAKVLSNAALQYNIKTEEWPVVSGDQITAYADLNDLADDDATNSHLTDALIEEIGLAVATGTVATDDAAVTDFGIFPVDIGANDGTVHFDSLVKNTKNPIGEYYLITAGDYAGEVFFIKSLEDSSGVWHNGVYELETVDY